MRWIPTVLLAFVIIAKHVDNESQTGTAAAFQSQQLIVQKDLATQSTGPRGDAAFFLLFVSFQHLLLLLLPRETAGSVRSLFFFDRTNQTIAPALYYRIFIRASLRFTR